MSNGSLKKWFKYFSSVPIALKALLLVSILALVIIYFINNDTKILSIIQGLFLACISSFIFYFIVIHIKFVSNLENVNPYIELKTKQLINNINSIILEMKRASKSGCKETYPSKKTINEMCAAISPIDNAPFAYRILKDVSSWINYLMNRTHLTEEHLRGLFSQSQYLESEHISILLCIQENPLSSTLELCCEKLISGGLWNKDLTFLADSIFKYSQGAKALDEYSKKHFKDYEKFTY